MKWWKVEHRYWQSKGQGFDSLILHPEDQRVTEVKICDSFLFARILPDYKEEMGKAGVKVESKMVKWYYSPISKAQLKRQNPNQ